MKRFLGLLIAIVLVGTAEKKAAAQVELSDSTFDTADWTSFSLNTSSGPASVSFSQMTTGGNPGSFMDLTVAAPAGLASGASYNANAGLISSALTYDPSTQGAITSIAFSFDMSQQAGLSGVPFLYFEQNNILYLWTPIILQKPGGLDGPTWATYSGAVSNFTLLDLADDHAGILGYDASGATTTTAPDFSSTGSPIEFGFGEKYETNQTSSAVGLDNLDLTINPVPEPPAVLLMLAGVAVGFLLRRWVIKRAS